MTDKALQIKTRRAAAGWMVQAFVLRVGIDPKMLLFAVALPDPDDAIRAVQPLLGGLHIKGPFAIASLTKAALNGLKPGEVRADEFGLTDGLRP